MRGMTEKISKMIAKSNHQMGELKMEIKMLRSRLTYYENSNTASLSYSFEYHKEKSRIHKARESGEIPPSKNQAVTLYTWECNVNTILLAS